MLNKEKFANEIADLAVQSVCFGFDKEKNIIKKCLSMNCEECLFYRYGKRCNGLKKEWANSEYVEHKVFTEKEKQLIKLLDKIKYVVRNENGTLTGYGYRPSKDISWIRPIGSTEVEFKDLTSLPFNAIKWEDEKPTSREEILGELL